jgi:calcineurin-like phosphoesterase family protein
VARTLVVSDLHLGTRAGTDVLSRDGVLEGLLDALEGVDRVVLLGDILELRQGNAHAVLERARTVLERLGERLGERAVVLVPGNHDHALIGGWLERRPGALGLEQRCAPREASFVAEACAAMLAPAPTEVAYPGLWVADGVYAMHGHYLDLHMTVPTIERLAVSVSGRLSLDGGRRWDDARSVDDYEAVLSPVYAWVHAAAQSGRASEAIQGGRTMKAWNALRPPRGRALRSRALPVVFPWAVRALNTAGLGPLSSEISGAELRRAGLRAASEVVERLAIKARHVIFGHTHRAGMIDGDEPAEWLTPSGTALHNAGSWIFSGAFSSGPQSAYWPGTAVLVEDGSPPRLLSLLAERTTAQLTDAGGRPVG